MRYFIFHDFPLCVLLNMGQDLVDHKKAYRTGFIPIHYVGQYQWYNHKQYV